MRIYGLRKLTKKIPEVNKVKPVFSGKKERRKRSLFRGSLRGRELALRGE